MEPNFVHLRIHTEYSISNGLLRIPALIDAATAFKMPAIGLTDQSNVYAAVKFYQAAMQAGIKPIIGADLWLLDHQRSPQHTRFTLLCQTNQGYKNLLTLISKSYLEGQVTGQPTIHAHWLTTLNEGLIALSGAEQSNIGQALLHHDEAAAKRHLMCWQTLFPQRFYLELCRVGKPQEEEYLQAALKLASAHAIPVVATNDAHFLTQQDFEAHEARICIQTGRILNDTHRPHTYTDQQYFRSQEEMQRLFADIPEALAHTVEIAKRCNVTLHLGHSLLPHFPVPDQYTTERFLCEIAQQGLAQRLQIKHEAPRQAYKQRLERELTVINNMGFAGYFLIVADFTKWAKENGIPVGPGRGSGPGSLVAYALSITDLDPLTHELLFERFLNPERVSMPDFDIDFCVEGRDRVIEYVMSKHGYDSVSQIITYGTMAAKAVVRDVGRVLALGYNFVDKIAKLIPFELGITLEKALEQEPLLRERYEQEEEVRTLIDLARKLEGIIRNVGKHAGGIVIAPGKLTDFVPLYCESGASKHPITQFDKDDVESVGLVKFDFLGLKTLTIIDQALRNIRLLQPQEKEVVDIHLIPLDDVPTFTLLKTCQSTAIFQLESHGMRDLIKRLQPDCFEDLIALVALFRPGPLQSGMVDDFINRKHGRATVTYPHPKLEPILRATYGVILYQEQVMQIAQVLAGYTLGSADILRRAMGKKKPEEMAKQRQIFCQGAIERQVSADVADHIFDLMEKFAGYGFNKSHSASYALIAYQTAWLKAHYPAAFMAAVLTADMDRTDKILTMMDECQALKLSVSPPNINQSEYFFKVMDHQHILFGLGAIKGVGQAAIENITETRKQGGLFRDLFDFCHRVDLRKVNRRVLEALIKAGCFDEMKQHRASLIASIHPILQSAGQSLHNKMHGQQDLFSTQAIDMPSPSVEVPAWNDETRLQGEKETLGFYLSGHPFNQYVKELSPLMTCRIANIHPSLYKTVTTAGIITNMRFRQTKRGDRMALFTLDDGTNQIEVVCFAENVQKYRSRLSEDQLILVEGEVSIDGFSNQARIISHELLSLEEARIKFAKYLKITIATIEEINIDSFMQWLKQHQGGTCPIVLCYLHHQVKADITFNSQWVVKPTDALLVAMQKDFPIQSVERVY